MADKQDSAFVQATRSVFPRLPTEIIVSIVRLLVWLTTLSFVEHAPQVLRLPLIFIWFAVFLARYVLGSAKDPERRAARDRDRRRIGVRLPRAQIPYVAALFLLAFVVGPWWGAAFTGGCGKAEWVDFVFAPRATLTNDTLPIGLSVMLLGLSLATYPLVEEFCTRGWLLAALRERLGVHWAVAIAAFAFAFLHLTPYTRQFVSIFVFCFGYGYAVVFTGTIWSAVAMHFGWNVAHYLLSAPGVHGYFVDAYRSALFRCYPSYLVVAAGALTLILILVAARRTAAATPL